MPDNLNGRLTPGGTLDGTLNNQGTLRGMLGGTGAVVTYASLPDKPSINDVILVGNKTTSDLNISFNDLTDQPVIPDVGEIDERLDDLEEDTGALDGRLTTAEGDITALGGRVTTAEGNITALGGRVTTAEGNITTLQGDTGALDGRLTTAEGDITQLNTSLSKFINGGEKTCAVNSSGLLNLSVAFSIPPTAYDINVEVINDTVAPSGVVRWINNSWYVFVLAAGTGNTIERRPNTDTTVRCSWRLP